MTIPRLFIVEHRLPRITDAELALLQATLNDACLRLTARGEVIGYLGSTYLAGPERLLSLFEAVTADAVRIVCESSQAPASDLEAAIVPPPAAARQAGMSYPGETIPAQADALDGWAARGMATGREQEPAAQPEDLGTFFLERANAGDVEGLVALYEPGAVLAFPPGRLATGHEEIRAVYAELLAGRPRFSSAGQQPTVRNGDLALTSTRLPGGGATVEVARRQPDGSWRWVIDQPAVLP